MIRKFSYQDMLSQARWLNGISRGYRGKILLITGLSTINGLLGVWSALLIKTLIDTAVGAQQGSLAHTGLLFVLVLVLQIILNAAHNIVSTSTKTKQTNGMQLRLFQKYMAAKWQPLSQRHSGDLCSRMLSDVDAVNAFVMSTIPSMISTFAQLLAASWLLFRMEPLLALLALTITPVFILLAKLFAKPMREATINIQSLKGDHLALSQESIQNIVTIRAFEGQDKASDKLSSLQSRLFYWTMRRTKLGTLSEIVQSLNWYATFILSLLWGVTRLNQSAAGYGSIAAYLQLVGQIQGPLRQLIAYIPHIVATTASIGRLMEVLDMPEEEANQGHSPIAGPVGVTLNDVSFSYQDGEKVLDGLSMEVPPNTITALIGQTGAGKSTIIRLLLGLIEHQSGRIQLYRSKDDTYPISACTRSAFTYVQQGNTAISGTIADNLRMAKPDATPNEMEAVLKLACAWDFVSALPNVLESSIGEHGIGLSEGQQQRLAIARSLLRDAPILILDEATSALDKKTEAQVLLNIQSTLHGRTCLIITHRSAALKLCSRVYSLSDGKAYLSTAAGKGKAARYAIKKSGSLLKAAPAS